MVHLLQLFLLLKPVSYALWQSALLRSYREMFNVFIAQTLLPCAPFIHSTSVYDSGHVYRELGMSIHDSRSMLDNSQSTKSLLTALRFHSVNSCLIFLFHNLDV